MASALSAAAECEPAPAPLGEVEQLRAALEESGSVAELSRRSGHPVEQVRARLVAAGLVGPKQRRGSLTAEQLGHAGRDYEAGATLHELARSYGVGTTYLRVHLTQMGVRMRSRGGLRPGRRGQRAEPATALCPIQPPLKDNHS